MDNPGPFRYRADVIEQLWAHGAHPTDRTRPELAREFVRELYKYEIRKLRQQMLTREFPKAEYSPRVETLRRRYPVLALPARLWIEQP